MFEYLAKKLLEIEVTEEEFIQAMLAEGKSEEEAKLHAKISKSLGGSCVPNFG